MADSQSRAGNHYASVEVLNFVDALHAPDDDALTRAYTAPEREGMPAIQVSRAEARTLELLLKMVGARRVVEVGTLAGYSALRLARALPADGVLWTLENEPLHARVARQHIEQAGLGERVRVVEGDGLASLAGLVAQGPFDAMFIDADKGRYPEYARWAATHLRPGGLLLADNVFLFGKLLEETHPNAVAMRAFHQQVVEAFDTACIPTPDGMLIGVRR